MRSGAFVGLLLALLLLLGGAPRAAAQEPCSGCKGQGVVTCGRCTWPSIGKCSTCGPQSLRVRTPGQRCETCKDTGKCVGCDGRGAQCFACKGTGRLGAGQGQGGQAAAPQLTPEQATQAIRQALEPFRFLAGRPLVEEGEEGQRGRFQSQVRIEPRVEGTFLRCEYTQRFADGAAVPGEWMLTFDPAAKEYVLVAFGTPGQVTVLRGRAAGDALVFSLQGARMTWVLRAGEALESVIEVQTEEGWVRASAGVVRPAR